MSNKNQTYLTLLTDIVTKKENLLGQLILDTIKQSNCIGESDFQEEKYDEIYQAKLTMIKEIESLDEGFGNVYEHIRDELKENKYAYETEIRLLQDGIRKITEKGLRLQKLENDNRKRFENMLVIQRKKVKDYKVSKKTAATYYKNMMKQFEGDSAFYNRSQ